MRLKDTVKRIDYFSMICTLVLFIIGTVFVFSATKSLDSNLKYIIIQTVAMLIGLVLMYIITLMDYDDMSLFWKFIAGGCIFLLILVLFIGQGKESTGTKGWIRFGPIGIQPAEFVKIGFIITLSKHIDSIGEGINDIRNILMLLLHLAVPVFLILLQPDFGTAMVFIFIFVVMVFVAGINWKYILCAIGAGGVLAVIAWNFLLNDIQKQRFYAFLYPEIAPTTYGYHVLQSKIAIGSGGFSGKGIFKGIQTQLGILPEKHTDFIFAVIGEEGGFILSVIVVALLLALIVRTVIIAKNARNFEGSCICIGVAAMWFFHILENIGMTIGLMPVTGIPLPFVSYGGSSILTNFIALGLVQNVYMRKKSITFF
ncbi:MAG: rod shape-determining protein RodA [Clostridia bacterium]|nr:rod shape-determining protein RodA [Clostridia bacterium]MBQ9997993.1 rod shape-determining protein RodA [Clostridia bacterium]